jgi:hypothetical protein
MSGGDGHPTDAEIGCITAMAKNSRRYHVAAASRLCQHPYRITTGFLHGFERFNRVIGFRTK